MAVKNLSSVFIGIVDILGYKNAEKYIDSHGSQTASSIIDSIFTILDSYTSKFNRNGVNWIRYGDGYVIYSDNNNIESLDTMIKDTCQHIAFSLLNSIPVRIALTQGDIKIIESDDTGLTISGNGWNVLQDLEKSLDWMGGWLYLPSYDNYHHPLITKLVSTTHLVIQQNVFSGENESFTPPFKEGTTYQKDNSWFINWQKFMHQDDDANITLIERWWLKYTHGNINDYPAVLKKRENTIAFARYCNYLYRSANLIFHSKVGPDLKIEKICGNDA